MESEFAHKLVPYARQWLTTVLTKIIITWHLTIRWKHVNVIAIVKSDKIQSKDAPYYRPISLFCVLYKLLERLILQTINADLKSSIPIEQAQFRAGRSCCDQHHI